MSRDHARIYIERMKNALGARTDEALATKLGYSKQAISSWRTRDTIPDDVARKMCDAFGPDFATDAISYNLAMAREDEVVYAVALHIAATLLSKEKQKTPELLRSWGNIFPALAQAVRTELRQIGFEQENSLSMIDILQTVADQRGLKSVERVLERLAPFNG